MADTLASGASARKRVGVQIPPRPLKASSSIGPVADVIVPVIASLSALGGAALGGWITFRVEKTRAENDRKEKRQDLKREILTDFFFRMTDWALLCQFLGRQSRGGARDTVREQLNVSTEATRRAQALLVMVCSEEVFAWHEAEFRPALRRLYDAVNSRLNDETMQIQEEVDDLLAALNAGRPSLRRDFGM